MTIGLLYGRPLRFRSLNIYSRVQMGSANFNDRSQRGDGDSEIALVVEDTDMIPSRMNGQQVSCLHGYLCAQCTKIST